MIMTCKQKKISYTHGKLQFYTQVILFRKQISAIIGRYILPPQLFRYPFFLCKTDLAAGLPEASVLCRAITL